jgi:hypothetical protein
MTRSPPARSSPPRKAATAKIGGVTVLTNAKGFTLYSFAPIPRPDRTATGRALATGRQGPEPRPPALA